MPRSRLGPLAIESKLGDYPSQSSVWRAIHVELQQPVAVKVFSTPFGGTPEGRLAFAEEWEQLKLINHPAIVRCYGGGFEATDAYLAFEYIEGETLRAQLERRTRLSWESVLDMAEPLASALEYLHARDIVHGRLFADKVLFSGLSPILIDVRVDRLASPYRTGQPLTAEELALMSPEQVDDPSVMSVQTDLYALGALMYLAITGRSPAEGDSAEQIKQSVLGETPPKPASIALDCPIWLDKLIMQLIAKRPASRLPTATAATLALAEVRRRSMSRAGAAEHASAGFSPLNVNDQQERNEARALLGRQALTLEQEETKDDTAWHDRPWVLIGGLILLVAGFAYLVWPLDEDQMRQRAEALLNEETRRAMHQAKVSYLEPMIHDFPNGRHTTWAKEQIDRVEMVQAEHALQVKLKRNLPLRNEGERLFAEAAEFERFGDTANALDKYRSMVTLLADDTEYRPYVNLARRQIQRIEQQGTATDEAASIIQAKLQQADELEKEGKVVAAKKIWYSVIELYGNNEKVAPLVEIAQQRIAGTGATATGATETGATGTGATATGADDGR